MAADNRAFYGGEAPAAATHANITGGTYKGPESKVQAPWKCPACKADNSGPLDDGCMSCGSGTVKARRADPPPTRVPEPGPIVRAAERLEAQHAEQVRGGGAESIESIALRWLTANPDATLTDAFVAGFQAARGRMIGAPPATVDLPQLSVEGKAKRTITAALEHFKEHVLPRAIEEVASGEWCSAEEIDTLIQQFADEEPEA